MDVMLRDGKVSLYPPPLTPKEANLVLSLYAELRLRDVPMIVMETWLGPLLAPGMDVLLFLSFSLLILIIYLYNLFNCINELVYKYIYYYTLDTSLEFKTFSY